MDHQTIGFLFERVNAGVQTKMISSLSIQFENERHGYVILNDDPNVLIASGDRCKPIPPSEIQIIKVRVASAFYHLDGWPNALEDALNRLDAAVTISPPAFEESRL